MWRRWLLLGIVLLLTTAGTWAFLEFFALNRLPAELVGRWEVIAGPPVYREAIFEFHRSGKMIGHINAKEMVHVFNAEVRVEGDKIYSTTRHPRTGQEKVTVQTIRKLTQQELVVVDQAGEETRMARVR